LQKEEQALLLLALVHRVDSVPLRIIQNSPELRETASAGRVYRSPLLKVLALIYRGDLFSPGEAIDHIHDFIISTSVSSMVTSS
jgi:hypothetical protein